MSSYTPDELRRERLMKINDMVAYKKIIRGFFSRTSKVPGAPDWPGIASPFSRETVRIIKNNLTKQGLFISQSYCSGVNMERNPGFPRVVNNVLSKCGIELVAFYYFKEMPAVSLIVGVKTDKRVKGETVCKYGGKALSGFHGRSKYRGEVVKLV